MVTTPQLGLKVWNLTTDSYDSGQLADNWARVDEHDHSSGKGIQIPTGGIADGAVTLVKLATGVNVPTDGSITPAKLSWAGNFDTYRVLDRASGYFTGGTTADTYFFNESIGAVVAGANDPSYVSLYNLTGAEQAVGGKVTKLNISANVACNATAPATTFTLGLYAITVAGTASNFAYTAGALQTGSTVTFTTPSASTVTPATSGDFTLPADGAYAIGCVTSGSTAANSMAGITARLRVRNV